MKSVISLLLAVVFSHTLQARESGPGNGTDYVKVLFAEAQYSLLSTVSSVNDADLTTLTIDASIKSWLLASQNGQSHWQTVKRYLKTMDLQYQQEPCSDFTKKPASICFFNEDPLKPYVMISLFENKMTTKTQAMAMLIHEAGHFAGETDHIFLDHVGVQLVAALEAPTLLIADAESKDTSGIPFAAKNECEAGTSQQAQTLKKLVMMNLTEQCSTKKLICDLTKAQLVFQGVSNFIPGVGYDMSVTCKARAILTLR